ncbi:F-box/FBD/LRR-repeat protein At1g13570 [Cajanus cajan]|uniref:F-box/FBD/LRR-repeat protein At1g13570 n=1 Tax=Cajanus cajan TaxID=3821 RepID=UPI00098D8F15|nr:F-box/FBD/LRR-repeat protein At1g13570 [Cajanus cajan]
MTRYEKEGHAHHNDQISYLPSNLTDSILSKLSIQDLIRTSILSRGWRYKWTSVPQLAFENDFFEKCKHLEFHETSSVITQILLLHSGPIVKFTLYIPKNFPIKMECLNKWINLLSGKGIKFLKIVNLQNVPFQTPSHIFSCNLLTHLELYNFKLSFVPNFGGFKSMFTLILDDIIFESNALQSLMFVCPSLVILTISYCSGFECINICSPTLKDLRVSGDEFIKSICLEKAKNMTHLSLMNDQPGNNFERDTVTNLIKGLSKIESICLGEGYIQIFSEAGFLPKGLQTSFNTLKYLELDSVNFCNSREILFVISLLKSSPNLKELLIESRYTSNVMEQPHTLEVSKYNSCCLSQLQTVSINVYKVCRNTLNFIQYLLANSPSLESIAFTIDAIQEHSILGIKQDLQQMARVSKKVEVELSYEYIY